ncbi:MAG: membrane or secreted protein [Planctomycetota bacterium]
MQYMVFRLGQLGQFVRSATLVLLLQAIFAAPLPAQDYTPAIQIIPDSIAGLLRIPDLPTFCDAAQQTQVGQLLADPTMEAFVNVQRERAKEYLQDLGNKVGLKIEDVYDIASGEVVLAWLPFEKDQRRPYALCIVADVRQRDADVQAVLAQIDADLKAGKWKRTNVQHRGQDIRVYDHQPKPGQLKVQQIAISYRDGRIMAADRASVVRGLIDGIAGKAASPSISSSEDFRTVLSRSAKAMPDVVRKQGQGTIAAEWFARPFSMGKIIREAAGVDRGNKVDILALLQRQGFDAIQAAGGIAMFDVDAFDVLHRGYVLAPATAPEPQRYAKAARMLRFLDSPIAEIPSWVADDVATFNRLYINIENAFWATEPLFNDAVGDEIFRDIFEGIKDDRGPEMDIPGDVLPNLENSFLFFTDNTQPATLESDRYLAAVRVKSFPVIAKTFRRWLDRDPDSEKIPAPGGIDLYRLEPNSGGEDDAEDDIFGGIDDDEELEAPNGNGALIISRYFIAIVPNLPGCDGEYLMVSSHKELMLATLKGIASGNQKSLNQSEDTRRLREKIRMLGGEQLALERLLRTSLSLRAKYQLLRAGKLGQSNSVVANLYRRIVGQEDPEEKLNAQKLPPFKDIERFFPNGAAFLQTTDDGWAITGFFLK